MVKVFISQPMRGLTDEEIEKERERIRLNIELISNDFTFILDSHFTDFQPKGNIPVAFLGKAISLMSEADVVYFGKGWEAARGCRIEHKIASEYNMKIIYEEVKNNG